VIPVYDKKHALAAGYEQFFGPCLLTEGWMIDKVVDDAKRNKSDVIIVEAAAQRQRSFWVYKRRFDAKKRKGICNLLN
jgi:hypothetical protein